MLQHIEAMKVALSVLTALTERSYPDLSEIQALRAYAPQFRDRPPDELAREVIQQALQEDRLVHAAE